MKTILTIIKKELQRVFTDKRTLVSMILPGVLIFIVYSLIGTIAQEVSNTDDKTYYVCTINQPAQFSAFNGKEVSGLNIDVTEISPDQLDAHKEAIEKGNLDLLIVYPQNFIQQISTYDSASGLPAPEIEIFYNSSQDNSEMIYQYYYGILSAYESQQNNLFDINPGEAQYDLSSPDDLTKKLISTIMPYFIVIMLFTGCMTMATESIAGEKERGTMATLLVTPTKRSSIVIGKVIALSASSLVPALSSFLGIMFSLPKMMAGLELDASVYGFGTYVQLLLVVFGLELLFNVLLCIVSALSKTIKEAQTYASPLMLVVTMLALFNMIGSISSATWIYFIPIFNAICCLSEIFRTTATAMEIALTIVINAVFFIGGVFALSKIFNSEKLMSNA